MTGVEFALDLVAGTAEPSRRGATLAVHSTLGYAGGFVGPLLIGYTLDLAGGIPPAPDTMGDVVASFERARTEALEVFRVDSTTVAAQPFQGRRERTVFGAWTTETRTLAVGTWAVRVDQPLGRLAFYLLEPRSDDGFLAWGLLDEALEEGGFPVLRSASP